MSKSSNQTEPEPAHILKLKRPRAILFDVIGTIAKTSFIDQILSPYVLECIEQFFEQNYHTEAAQIDIDSLRWQAAQDSAAPQIPAKTSIESSDDDDDNHNSRQTIIESTVAYVQYAIEREEEEEEANRANREKNSKMASEVENKALTLLRFHMWFDAFASDRVRMPVYTDAAKRIREWHRSEIPLYVLSNGWREATRRFFARTTHGDLTPMIEDFFDTKTIGAELYDPIAYRRVADRVAMTPDAPAIGADILYLTKCGANALAAIRAGLTAVLVLTHRRNIEQLDDRARQIARIRTLNDLRFE